MLRLGAGAVVAGRGLYAMLPNIRAVLGAIVAAIVLLMMSFGLVATLRVAQDSRAGVLHADLAQRTRTVIPPNIEARAVVLVEKPAPLEPNPVRPVEVKGAPEIVAEAPAILTEAADIPVAVALGPPQAEPVATEPMAAVPPPAEPPAAALPATASAATEPAIPEQPTTDVAAAEPPATEVAATEPPTTIEQLLAEPPMGGPLAEPTSTQAERRARKAAHDRAVWIAKKKAVAAKRAEKAAAAKIARAARITRLTRERKAAARRATQARAKQQAAAAARTAPAANSFGSNLFGNGGFGNSTFNSGAFGNNTFGTGTFGTNTTRR